MRTIAAVVALMVSGCNALLGLDEPALGTGDASDAGRDAFVDEPCTPTSFEGASPLLIATTVQRFSIATDESFAILTINADIHYLVNPGTPGLTPIPAEGFEIGINHHIALTHESDQLFLNNINNATITRSTVITPPGIWNTPVTQQGFQMATVARPSAGGMRMVTNVNGQPDLVEYVQTGTVWTPEMTHPRTLLIDASGIGVILNPSLSADGLVLVYVISGGPVEGINYATRAATDQPFMRVELLFPGVNIIGAQLTANCSHLWFLQSGSGSVTRLER